MRLKNIFKLETYKNRINYFFEDIRIKRIIKQKYKDYIILMPNNPLGETFITISLIKEIQKKYKCNKILLLITYYSENFVEYFKKICNFEVLVTDKNFIAYKHQCLQRRGKNFLTKGFIYSIIVPFNPNLTNIFPKNMFDYHKYLLDLKTNSCATKFDIAPILISEIKEKYNITNKTVFLSPEANSLDYKVLSINFWKNLANILIKLGYQVLINTNSSDKYIGYPCIFDTVLNTVAIAENCCCVVAFRSGLMDIFAGMVTKKMCVIYPGKDYQIYISTTNDILEKHYSLAYPKLKRENMHEAVLTTQSLKNSYDRKNIKEVLFDGSETKLFDEIIRFIIDKQHDN